MKNYIVLLSFLLFSSLYIRTSNANGVKLSYGDKIEKHKQNLLDPAFKSRDIVAPVDRSSQEEVRCGCEGGPTKCYMKSCMICFCASSCSDSTKNECLKCVATSAYCPFGLCLCTAEAIADKDCCLRKETQAPKPKDMTASQ